MIARLGNDEFAVLFEGAFGHINPSAAPKRMIEQFSIPFELGAEAVIVSASFGVATDLAAERPRRS